MIHFHKYAKRVVLGFAALLWLAAPAVAPAQAGLRGSGAHVGLGLRTLDLEDVNDALQQSGYTRFHQTLVTFGGGGYSLRGRMIRGGEGYGWSGRRAGADQGSDAARLGGGFGTFVIGYLHTPGERVNLYPMLGIGGGRLSLEVTEPVSQERRARSSTLSTNAFVVSMSLGADYLVTMRRTGSTSRGLAAGMRAGYTNTLARSDWSRRGPQTIGEPVLSLDGFSLMITLGTRKQTVPHHLAGRGRPDAVADR